MVSFLHDGDEIGEVFVRNVERVYPTHHPLAEPEGSVYFLCTTQGVGITDYAVYLCLYLWLCCSFVYVSWIRVLSLHGHVVLHSIP